MATSAADCYWEYLKSNCPALDSDTLSRVAASLESTSWDDPTSSQDLNNFAVVALIEAEQCQELTLRTIYLEMALEALNKGIYLDKNPLCAAHLALLQAMIGELDSAIETAFPTFLNTLQSAYVNPEKIPLGLVYLPTIPRSFETADNELIIKSLQAENGYIQSLILLSEALCRAPISFFNKVGLRFLNLATQIFPASTTLNFKLGIYSIFNNQWEGLFYLHRARQIAPDCVTILQALYLIYRDLAQPEIGNFWLGYARELHQMNPNFLDLYWTELGLQEPFTYVAFDTELLLAVEPSFRSIVTSVLIAEGDWFEKELEFWRNFIQPGMIVIDVGANVGVYTFSAALRVGSEGRVLAIEPFSGCVRCLQETCRINQIGWVKVCAGAASDREGTARLSLHSASELNEIVANDALEIMAAGSFEEVTCFSLDSLIDRENLSQVDFLKIDAEGHEMSVLAGSNKILSQFYPIIIYENQTGVKGSNLPLANALIAKGYQLFRYQPYKQKLMPIEDEKILHRQLNVIAIPSNKLTNFLN